ncbi:MAG: DUF308 domain-containing protein [Nitrosopumilus sp.]|nr:DUF308 domain-containing protein [Nitrosopumilus sp.]
MADDLTCAECGSEIDSNLSYCPNCKCNIESKESNKIRKSGGKQKLFNHPIWGLAYIIIGVWAIVTGVEWYFYILGVILLIFGIHKLYKTYKEKNQEQPRQF